MVGSWKKTFPTGARPIFKGYVSFTEGKQETKHMTWAHAWSIWVYFSIVLYMVGVNFSSPPIVVSISLYGVWRIEIQVSPNRKNISNWQDSLNHSSLFKVDMFRTPAKPTGAGLVLCPHHWANKSWDLSTTPKLTKSCLKSRNFSWYWRYTSQKDPLKPPKKEKMPHG